MSREIIAIASEGLGPPLEFGPDDTAWKRKVFHWKGQLLDSIQAAERHFVKRCKVTLLIYESLEFRALCKSVDDQNYAICFSASLFPFLYNLCLATTSMGANLPQYKSTTRKFVSGEFRSNKYLTEQLFHDALHEPTGDTLVDFDADNIMRICMEILVSHELAHILGGHVKWSSEALGYDSLDETPPAGTDNQTDHIFQTLEWDADSVGIQRSLLRCYGLTPPDINGLNSRSLFKLAPDGPFGTNQNTAYSFAVGLGICTSIFDLLRLRSGTTTKHPPSWFRQDYAMKSAMHSFSSRVVPFSETDKFEFKHFFGDSFLHGCFDFRNAWEEALGNPSGFGKEMDKADTDKAINLINEYSSTWRMIHPELYNHKIVPTAWDAV